MRRTTVLPSLCCLASEVLLHCLHEPPVGLTSTISSAFDIACAVTGKSYPTSLLGKMTCSKGDT